MLRLPGCLALLPWLLLLALVGCAEDDSRNLLRDRQPTQAHGISDVERLTDGLGAPDGSDWLGPRSAALVEPGASALFDLGTVQPLGCLWLQGDNNDDYLVASSLDGRSFTPIWVGGSVAEAGLQLRQTPIELQTRYLMVSAHGGDGRYSLSEFGAASRCPGGAEAFIQRPLEPAVLIKGLLLGAVLLALLALFAGRVCPRPVVLLLTLLGLAAAAGATFYLTRLPAVFALEPAIRAAVAALAAGVALREAFVGPLSSWRRRAHSALLGALTLVALASYYHFGHLQFRDESQNRQTFVHATDMRHYFPLAKYFPELRFDGMYLASVAAYQDNHPDADISDVILRDLRNSEVRHVRELLPELTEIRTRFSAERWQAFRDDMSYFEGSMGSGGFLGHSLRDHGGNATPVWILSAWLIFRDLPASELSLTLAGLLDPLLLLVLFGCIWRTFGSRPALYAAILFGATDFYMFGSNLVGSTLRLDWLVALGLGACALRSGRPLLGGALLAYGALIRAFPALTVFFLAVPLLWWLLERWRSQRPLSLTALWQEQAATLRAGLGALAMVLAMLALTSFTFGFQNAWVKWYEKVSIHAEDPSVNNIGLRNLMSFSPQLTAQQVLRPEHPEPWIDWQRTQRETYASRWLANAGILLLALGALLLACYRRALHQSALLGLLAVPFLFYLSNYYYHFIFLLPLALAPARGDAARSRLFAWGVLLLGLVCVGQYFSLAEHWSDERYTWQCLLLMGAFSLMLLPMAIQGGRRWMADRPRAAE
ncbi:MAG: hypothetical protein V4812_03065 [Pseudomonadota bacterium]